ncbi:MAG: hypothetical protein QXU39_00555, partial [Candidatus Pacearchaeota archaeon]
MKVYLGSIKSKRGIEFSFAWLFAIIIGAIIIFFAIYASTKIIKTGGEAMSAKAGREIGIILNPLETGFGTSDNSESVFINMPVETRIYNLCDNSGSFGKQIIKVSQKNLGKWADTEIYSGFQNKYIFSKNFEEGKNFFMFSKPFYFPFKVADLIYLTSQDDKYCFENAPDNIKKEIEDLGQENLLTENCPEGSIRICFDSTSNCEIKVSESLRKVEKNNQVSYYETDALMYAAIFSDKEIYECHIERLMKRAIELAFIYQEKDSILNERGCTSGVGL